MKRIIVFLLAGLLLLSGCAALRKKFTRKPKKKDKEIEDIVFVPVEYPDAPYTKEQQYTNQYLFWKSWHAELINYLYEGAVRKKQISCANEALKSLNKMKDLLPDDRKEELQVHIKKMKGIADELTNKKVISVSTLKRKATSLQNRIQRSFSYTKVVEYLE